MSKRSFEAKCVPFFTACVSAVQRRSADIGTAVSVERIGGLSVAVAVAGAEAGLGPSAGVALGAPGEASVGTGVNEEVGVRVTGAAVGAAEASLGTGVNEDVGLGATSAGVGAAQPERKAARMHR
jgi:hypothetical protein